MISELLHAAVMPNVICDHPTPLSTFRAPDYMGTWICQDNVKDQPFQENDWTCIQAVYNGLQADGSFDVDNTCQGKDFGPRFGSAGDGSCPDNNGQCYVAFYNEPYPSAPNYIIVDTDYLNYSIVYSCTNFRAYLWYLSRTAQVDQAWRDNVQSIAMAALPNFNFSMMVNPAIGDIQGPQCTYNDPQPLPGIAYLQ
jgi:lipocalin